MASAPRSATVTRETRETRVEVSLRLDGDGTAEVSTGVGFLDHMLASLARHGLFTIQVRAAGDLHVDTHHVVEDVGIVLGQALREALGDKAGITRFGDACVPMDEALVQVAVDISGRGMACCSLGELAERIGGFETETAEGFFQAFAGAAGANLHIVRLAGSNSHHVLEAAFKALARALDLATRIDPRFGDVPSTKGTL